MLDWLADRSFSLTGPSKDTRPPLSPFPPRLLVCVCHSLPCLVYSKSPVHVRLSPLSSTSKQKPTSQNGVSSSDQFSVRKSTRASHRSMSRTQRVVRRMPRSTPCIRPMSSILLPVMA